LPAVFRRKIFEKLYVSAAYVAAYACGLNLYP
jgi:hypothetical protein